jgi:hypothetical protein
LIETPRLCKLSSYRSTRAARSVSPARLDVDNVLQPSATLEERGRLQHSSVGYLCRERLRPARHAHITSCAQTRHAVHTIAVPCVHPVTACTRPIMLCTHSCSTANCAVAKRCRMTNIRLWCTFKIATFHLSPRPCLASPAARAQVQLRS